jgi:hypothetical protein
MNVVKVLTSDGKPVATYPDAYALLQEGYLFVFDSSVEEKERLFSYNGGNWIACFSGPIISWEEPQKEAGS